MAPEARQPKRGGGRISSAKDSFRHLLPYESPDTLPSWHGSSPIEQSCYAHSLWGKETSTRWKMRRSAAVATPMCTKRFEKAMGCKSYSSAIEIAWIMRPKKRLMREIDALQKLKHINIIQILDWDEQGE